MAAVVIGMSLLVVRMEVDRADINKCEEEIDEDDEKVNTESEESKMEHAQLPPSAGGAPAPEAPSSSSPIARPLPTPTPRDAKVSNREAQNANRLPQILQNPWTRLLFCFVCIQISQLLWGIAQEDVMTVRYYDNAGNVEQFSADFPIFWNRLFSAFFFGGVLYYLNQLYIFDGFWLTGAPAITNACASLCQYESLKYVTFALQTTAKTTKLLPVVVINTLRGKPQSLLDYAEAVTMVAALFVFGLETQEAEGADYITTSLGIILLIGLIFCDSLTPHLQDWVFDKHSNISAVQMMFSTACIASTFLLVPQLCTGAIFKHMAIVARHPESILHLIVLAISSALTQYFLIFTVQQFGPVVTTIVVSIRQIISVAASALVFHHPMTPLAGVAMLMAFFVVLVRAARKPIIIVPRSSDDGDEPQSLSINQDQGAPAIFSEPNATMSGNDYLALLSRNYLGSQTNYGPFLKCALAIHVLYGVYAIAQEYLATHTFHGALFSHPMFMVAVNHTCAGFFALMVLSVHNLPKWVPEMKFTALPAISDLIATSMQHMALYNLLFPTQTLMKTLKIFPVMIIGRILRSRTYTYLDYVEGIVLTALVGYFVCIFQVPSDAFSMHKSAIGIFMMVVYVVVDSFTSPLEDYVYQEKKLDPGQMLFGLELISGSLAWIVVIFSGEFINAVSFLLQEPSCLTMLCVMAVCAAAGAYTCTLTVRLFGPAIFILLMTSRSIMSLVISALLFQHKFDPRSLLCLVVVCLVVLVSSIRRVSQQMKEVAKQEKNEIVKQDATPQAGPSDETSKAMPRLEAHNTSPPPAG
jgi:adenosine 3'-phospho 5'-phosphosulfate transporter B2